MKKVLVLISTYNGEKFLQEQLDSLFAQSYQPDILVRDDGSTDSTLEILKKNQKKIKYYCGANIGCDRSFLDLVKNSTDDYDYYMFCDQDDFWLPNKVEAAVSVAEKSGKEGILYFSALNIVDGDLKPLENNVQTFPKDISYLTFDRSLLKSYGYGCTMLFDKKIKKSFSLLEPNEVKCHDWDIQKIALSCGTILYDSNAYINYRQHANNVIGFNKKKRLSSFIKQQKKQKNSRSISARLLLNSKLDFSEECKDGLEIVVNSKKIKNRFSIAFSKKYSLFSFKANLLKAIYSILGLI